jgi:hypothetical protein
MSAEEPPFARPSDNQLVTSARVEDVMDAIEALDMEAPWSAVRDDVRLVLPRRRPIPEHTGSLPTLDITPGIPASLGLDIGPAMLFISTDRLVDWDVSAHQAFEQALTNIRDRVAARSHFALIQEDIADTPTLAFQSREGWASGLLAIPELLCRVLGRDDGIILAAMRDLVLRLPLDADADLSEWILDEFADADMNALDIPPLALVDGQLRWTRRTAAPATGGHRMH